jgi:hypothetical protein
VSVPDIVADLMAKQQSSEGRGMSKLKLEVFAAQKFWPDKVIGELEEKIETLLSLDDNGGKVISSSLSRGY